MLIGVLQRSLPFVLTLMIGVGLSGLINFFNPRATETARPAVAVTTTPKYQKRCTKFSRPVLQATQPVIFSQPDPSYTSEARQRGVTGVVRLRVTFGADGKVSNIVPITPLPFGLTEEAVAAAEHIQFSPARGDGGEPISVERLIEYQFDLY